MTTRKHWWGGHTYQITWRAVNRRGRPFVSPRLHVPHGRPGALFPIGCAGLGWGMCLLSWQYHLVTKRTSANRPSDGLFTRVEMKTKAVILLLTSVCLDALVLIMPSAGHKSFFSLLCLHIHRGRNKANNVTFLLLVSAAGMEVLKILYFNDHAQTLSP